MTRVRILDIEHEHDPLAAMRREVRAGLTTSPRSIPPKYFYDERGSRLFDAICELPEYYLTRAEHALLERHADAIVAAARPTALVEIGSGMARKTALLVRALCVRVETPSYVPFDISREALEASARDLVQHYPTLHVCGIVGDFARELSRTATVAPPDGPRLFAFLGSTMGNLDETAAPALVRDIASLMTHRDRFLLGIDIVKDERVLNAAYNDDAGVTADFNKNVLRVLSRELDGDFDERAFAHLAFYDAAKERIEMHLVSLRRQRATLRRLDLHVDLDEGERMMTEISRKFTRASVARTLEQGGMRMERWIPDERGMFALALAYRA